MRHGLALLEVLVRRHERVEDRQHALEREGLWALEQRAAHRLARGAHGLQHLGAGLLGELDGTALIGAR